MRFIKFGALVWLLSQTITFTGLAAADVDFGGTTRFVFNAGDKAKTITIENVGKQAVLAQVTFGDGDDQQALDDLPLALSRPLIEIQPGDKQTVDILYQGVGLPRDRESCFLLSVMDIPKVPAEQNRLQIVLRHRLKVFFRPALPMSPTEAFTRLYWRQATQSKDAILDAHNDSPYFQTLTDVQFLDRQGRVCGKPVAHLMLPPFSTRDVQLADCAKPIARITSTFITDEGDRTPHVMAVTRSTPNSGSPI